MALSTAQKRARKSPTSKRPPFRFEVFGLTDVGLVREGNEDSLLLAQDIGLFAVADGMGGHNCGEVASAFTIEAISAFYRSSDVTRQVRAAYRKLRRSLPREQLDSSTEALRLRRAVEGANVSVFRLAQQHESLRDMGTTVVAAVFCGRRMYTSNVGDSRVYRLRDGRIQQLTEDHSLVNEYLRMNMLRPEDVETFPYKNVIVRAIGLHEQVTVDIDYVSVRAGDQILLCSDGLTDLVRDPEIERLLSGESSARSACERLTELAKDRGGHDNITTVLIRLHATEENSKGGREARKGGNGSGGKARVNGASDRAGSV